MQNAHIGDGGHKRMSVAKLAAGAAVLGLGFLFWQKHQAHQESLALDAMTDNYGFVSLAQPDGAEPKKVWIIAAVNCPKEGARRADYLAQQLAERNMSYDRRSHVSFTLGDDDQVLAGRIQKILDADTPIVIVNGKMKSNPDLDEVTAEYEAAQL